MSSRQSADQKWSKHLKHLKEQLRMNCPTCSRRAEELCDSQCVVCGPVLSLLDNMPPPQYESLDKRKFDTDMACLAHETSSPLYYPNNIQTAKDITDNIMGDNEILFHLVLAPTQSGKTGTFLSLIEQCITHQDSKISYKNVYVITGLSSVDWVIQTRKRMPACLHERILHRPDMSKISLVSNEPILIIIDEIHVASKEKMSIDKLLEDFNIKDILTLKSREIKIAAFSATPNKVKYDIEKWKDKSMVHIMQPGEGYVGVQDLMDRSQARQAIDLYIDKDPDGETELDREKQYKIIKPVYEELDKVKHVILDLPPLNHIIRTPSGCKGHVVENRIRSKFPLDLFDIIKCSGNSCNELQIRVSEKLIKKPRLLLIKDTMRCTVTLSKENLGIIYDRISNKIDDSVIIQGVRNTGYDVKPYNIIYTNISSLENYTKMWEENENAIWNYNGKHKNTVFSPNSYKNANIIEEANSADENTYRVYDDEQVVKNVCEILGYKYIATKNNRDGFMETSLNEKKKVVSLSNAISKVKSGYGTNHGIKTRRIYYPCYVDITNRDTLRFVLIIQSTDADKLIEIDKKYPCNCI